MPNPREIKLLQTILAETREARTENQRLHAHTDVVLVEAIRMHDADPQAHGGRITEVETRLAAVERKVQRLEGKHDDEKKA
jgi:hypothetical protein